jgi:2-octaprenyl-6-methoxyphenol hydroxylase
LPIVLLMRCCAARITVQQAVLERYARWRRFDIASTIAAMEGMSALFVNDLPGLTLLRQGHSASQKDFPAAKSALMDRSSRHERRTLPRLMRGM